MWIMNYVDHDLVRESVPRGALPGQADVSGGRTRGQ